MGILEEPAGELQVEKMNHSGNIIIHSSIIIIIMGWLAVISEIQVSHEQERSA